MEIAGNALQRASIVLGSIDYLGFLGEIGHSLPGERPPEVV